MCRSFHHAHQTVRSVRAQEPDPVRTPDDLRVYDAERDAVIAQLRRHVGDGRLTLDEFEQRVEDVTRARTGADLRAVTRDLPPLQAPRDSAPQRRGLPWWALPVGIIAVLSLSAGHLVLWPVFIFAFCGFGRWHREEPVVEQRETISQAP